MLIMVSGIKRVTISKKDDMKFAYDETEDIWYTQQIRELRIEPPAPSVLNTHKINV